MEKQCNTCKETKDISEFYKKSTSRDGLENRCKQCKKLYNKNRDVYAGLDKNKQQIRYKKYYYGNHEKSLQRSKDKYYKDVCKTRSYNRNFHADYIKIPANKEKHNKITKKGVEITIKQKPFYNRHLCDMVYIRKILSDSPRNKKLSEKRLGCTEEQFREYISKEFLSEMNFTNYGDWCLTTKQTIRNSDLNQKELCHYTNLTVKRKIKLCA